MRVGRKEQMLNGGMGRRVLEGVIPPGNLESFTQQAGELQDWARVHGVLKGTNLFCYRQPEDADTGEEPLFTIAINKVMGPLVVKLPGAQAQEHLLQAPGGWVQRWKSSLLLLLTAPHPASGPGMFSLASLEKALLLTSDSPTKSPRVPWPV